MDRRHFISTAARLGALGMAAGTGLSLAEPTEHAALSSRKQLFDEALKAKPWLLAFRTVQAEAYDATVSFTGKPPKELQGVLFRNGPARHEIGSFRYGHWFDGDGMVHRWSIQGGQVTHRARVVNTHKYRREREAGRAIYPAFGSAPPNAVGVPSADALNSANISVLPHHDRL